MFKKITTFLCTAAILISTVPVVGFSQSNTTSDEKASLLYAVGIDDGTAGGKATRDYFVKALSGFVYNAEEKVSPENFARLIGITEFGAAYNGSEKLTVAEALKYAVITLGYKEYAESMGDNGYNSVAASIGLTSGVNTSTDSITTDACRQILYNMLGIEPMSKTLKDGRQVYIINHDETLLSKYRNIYRIEGIITANDQTSLSSEDGCREGYVEINEILYKAEGGISSDEALLGKSVEAYVMTDSFDDSKVLYAGEKHNKNTEITIDAKDIRIVAQDFSKIEYEKNDRVKYAKLASVLKVVYNGVFYGAYTAADFKPEIGSLRLVDCDADGRYETVFVYSYETFVLGAVDVKENKLYNKFNITGRLYSVDLDENDLRYTITDGEKEIAINDLKIGDILSVAVSKSTSNRIIKILVSTENLKGKLLRVDESEKEIEIDEEIYNYTQDFFRFKSADGKDLSTGTAYRFYLDAFGNAAYRECVTEDGYAVLYRFYEDEQDCKYYVTYMNMDGEWVDAELAEKLTYNDAIYKEASLAYENLKSIRGKIAKLKTTSTGEIKLIETASESGTPKPNKFICTPSATYTYRTSNKSFDCKYYLDNDAKLIILPSNLMDKDGYAVREPSGYFGSDDSVTVSLYDFDEFGFTKLVSTTYQPKVTTSLFIVSGKATVCTSDGDVVGQLKGYTVDFDNVTLMGNNAEIFNSIKRGDILNLGMNSVGRVDSVKTIAHLGDTFAPLAATQYAKTTYMAGTVTAINAVDGKMVMDIGGTAYTFRLNGTEVVQEFSAEGSEVTASSIYGIVAGDKIFLYLNWGVIKNIIVKG